MANIEKRGKASFRLIVDLGRDDKGKKIRKTRTIRIHDEALLRTKRRLQDYLEAEWHKFKVEIEVGAYIDPSRMKFVDFVKEWEKKYAIKNLSETTIDNHMTHLENHIVPVIGQKRIDDVMPIHIINLLDNLERVDGSEDPLSSSTEYDVYRAIKSVFDRSFEWRLIKENPLDGVQKPKIDDEREINVYDEDEIKELLELAENELPHWRLFITLALTAGLRRSELLGLEWDAIDLETGILDIRQAIVRGRNGPLIKRPKSKTSFRLVTIPSNVLEELKRYKKHWNKEKLKMGEKWIEINHSWVFCNNDGVHFYPTTPTTWWNRFVKRAKVRHIRLHDIRHTNATLLIAQGVHAKIISERLGHSKINITMDTYGHLMRRADMEAANKLNDIFENKRTI